MERLSLEELKERAKAGTLIGGFLTNIEDYHDGPGLSSSDVKDMNQSFPGWRRNKLNQVKKKSDALEFGTLYHTTALEIGEFDKRYAITSLARKDSRPNSSWAKQEAAAKEEGKKLVKQSDIDTINAMFARIAGNEVEGIKPHSKRKLLLGLKEASFYWKDPQTGVLCKCRPDVITESGHIVDLKTTRCKDDDELQSDTYKFGYHISAAMYLNGVIEALRQGPEELHKYVPSVPKNFLFFFQGKKAPYPIFVRHLDPAALGLGTSIFRKTLDKYKEIEDGNLWEHLEEELAKEELSQLEPDNSPQDETIRMIGVPHWAYNEVG